LIHNNIETQQHYV